MFASYITENYNRIAYVFPELKKLREYYKLTSACIMLNSEKLIFQKIIDIDRSEINN